MSACVTLSPCGNVVMNSDSLSALSPPAPQSHPLPTTSSCMQDPAVMSSALSALHEVIKTDPRPYKNLVPSFTSILKQVRGGRGCPRVQGAPPPCGRTRTWYPPSPAS